MSPHDIRSATPRHATADKIEDVQCVARRGSVHRRGTGTGPDPARPSPRRPKPSSGDSTLRYLLPHHFIGRKLGQGRAQHPRT